MSIFSGKVNCVFLRKVTRCYAKNIIVQTFSVLLSHYYRITIALPSYTNARVIQESCLIGVNAQNFPFSGPLWKWFKSSIFALAFISDGCTNAMRSDEDSLRSAEGSLRRHWGGIGLYWEVQSIAIIVLIILSYPEKVDSKNLLIWERGYFTSARVINDY